MFRCCGNDTNRAKPSVWTEPSELIEQHKLEQGAAQQGLALSKEHYFTSTSATIYQFDTAWNLQNSRQVRIDGVNHLGAIHYYDGFIWTGFLYGPENGQYDKQLDRSTSPNSVQATCRSWRPGTLPKM